MVVSRTKARGRHEKAPWVQVALLVMTSPSICTIHKASWRETRALRTSQFLTLARVHS